MATNLPESTGGADVAFASILDNSAQPLTAKAATISPAIAPKRDAVEYSFIGSSRCVRKATLVLMTIAGQFAGGIKASLIGSTHASLLKS
jgi:hypothetical protein